MSGKHRFDQSCSADGGDVFPMPGGQISRNLVLEILDVRSFQPMDGEREAQVSNRKGGMHGWEALKGELKINGPTTNRSNQTLLKVCYKTGNFPKTG